MSAKYKVGDYVMVGENSNQMSGDIIKLTKVVENNDGSYSYDWVIEKSNGSIPESFISKRYF